VKDTQVGKTGVTPYLLCAQKWLDLSLW